MPCNPEAFTLSEAIATGSGNKTAEAKTPASAQCTASLPAIFWSFFKIGAFTFGGGWAMIPLIRRELVLRKRWLEDSEFVDLLAVAQSAPGPIAINTSVITGYKMRGFAGALVATLGSALPSFLVILAFATVLLRFKDSRAVAAVFKGMRPAIFGLLVSAVWQVGKTSIKTRADLAFLVAAAVLLLALKLNPIAVIAAAALAGVAAGRFTARGADQSGPAPPRREKRPGEEG